MAVDIRKLAEEIMREHADAEGEAARSNDAAGWSRVVGGVSGAFSGQRPNDAFAQGLERRGQQALTAADRSAATKLQSADLGMQADKTDAQRALDALDRDPQNPAAAPYRELYRKTLPNLDTSAWSLRQFKEASPALAKQVEIELENQRRVNKREQDLTDRQTANTEWNRRNDLTAAQAMERAKVLASQRSADKLEEATVPGLEIAPGAHPSTDDAKKMKAGLSSMRNIDAEAGKLAKTYADNGTELFGQDANRMNQAVVAMQLEAKNIAELGALSGPDMDLMRKLSSLDPTSFRANIKGMFGVDDTPQALAAFQAWARDRVANAKKTYGYRDPAGAAPEPAPAAGNSEAPPPGMKWQRNKSTGERRLVPVGGR